MGFLRVRRADGSEQQGIASAGRSESHVAVRQLGGFAAAGRAFEEAFLDQERLVDILDGAGIFSNRCSQSISPVLIEKFTVPLYNSYSL